MALPYAPRDPAVRLMLEQEAREREWARIADEAERQCRQARKDLRRQYREFERITDDLLYGDDEVERAWAHAERG